MHVYKAYGLIIHSEPALPELQSASATSQPDVSIRFGKVDWSLPSSLENWRYFDRDEDSIYCYWNIAGKFQIRAGAEVIVDLLPDVDESMIRLPLLGPVLALVLHQRSHLVLHASAVVINGKAAIFTAASGQGKSTTAATLYSRGHQLMTDDVSAIVLKASAPPMLLPGFPRVKLWPDAVNSATQQNPEDLERINQAVNKLNFTTVDGFCQESVPISRIYKLTAGESDKPQIVSLSHQGAVARLLENAFVPMLFRDFPAMLPQSQRFRNVLQCANLAKNVPVCKLERPYSLERLPDLAALIESDLSDAIAAVPSAI